MRVQQLHTHHYYSCWWKRGLRLMQGSVAPAPMPRGQGQRALPPATSRPSKIAVNTSDRQPHLGFVGLALCPTFRGLSPCALQAEPPCIVVARSASPLSQLS